MSKAVQQFAAGHDAVGSLAAFNALSPPLLKGYPVEIDQVWRSYDGVKLTGARAYKAWGLPSVKLTFGKLNRAEFAFLLTLQGDCTFRCFNEDLNDYANFNGTFGLVTAGDFNRIRDLYTGVSVPVIDLEVIS